MLIASVPARKGVDLVEQYVDTFAEVLKRLDVVMTPQPAAPQLTPSGPLNFTSALLWSLSEP